MHALHSLAHRAPPATRTRVRWQPYNSISGSSCSSISSRSPSAVLPNTPSYVTPSPPVVTPSVEFDRIRPTLNSTSQVLKDNNIRDPIKNKYAIGLVDQAVKSLCEIWHPQDIPVVFLTPPRGMVGTSFESTLLMEQKPPQQRHRNTQLPSPVSPCTQSSPLSLTVPPTAIQQGPHTTFQNAAGPGVSRSNLVPIKGFVHEVLRRSRTSGCVLQTALCYLEAIRSKVPELVSQERAGHGTIDESVSADRITLATDTELALEAEFNMYPDPPTTTEKYIDEDSVNTIRISSNESNQRYNPFITQEPLTLGNKFISGTPSPLPLLPSPLLCPRRAFLASLILASKFTQDKCYSNRAWAKLSGLPPREIGRCERALGEALEWRLWVGKLPTPQASPSSTISTTTRPILRSQSEHLIFATTATQSSSTQCEPGVPLAMLSPDGSSRGGLRRCATLPANAYRSHLDQGSWRTCHIPVSNRVQYTQSPNAANLPSTLLNKPIVSSLTSSSVPIYMDQCTSPSPDTPGLTYSPSSTESSSGDHTIQMTTFLDDPMLPYNPNIGVVGTEAWPWLDHPDGPFLHAKVSLPAFPGSINTRNTSTSSQPISILPTAWDKSPQIKMVPCVEPNQVWGENGVLLLPSQ
ncbi:hypothetical protein BDZ94DRAFT_39116 [Collybia nuda]|uniref:G1/S-specific cyclin pas1 n=1 Tax=Collybia nuda TaxID=64659 RepID=A0A9P6CQ60_9AGAR|nr:hypothetical protein BDZ94DRAFT_39116 [Collybia nuda]